MTPRRATGRGIKVAGFALDDNARRALSEKFPRVDLELTYEIFRDKALANGWLYVDWLAAFRNYIRNGKQYGGIVYKSGAENPAFDALIDQAKAINFRMPQKHESAGAYRTALNQFDKESTKRSPLGKALRRFPK